MQNLFQAVAHEIEVGRQGGGQVLDVAGSFDGGVVPQGQGSQAGFNGAGHFLAAGDLFPLATRRPGVQFVPMAAIIRVKLAILGSLNR